MYRSPTHTHALALGLSLVSCRSSAHARNTAHGSLDDARTAANMQVDTIHCNAHSSSMCCSPCLNTPRKAGQGVSLLHVAVGVTLFRRGAAPAAAVERARGQICSLVRLRALSTCILGRMWFRAAWYKCGNVHQRQSSRHCFGMQSCISHAPLCTRAPGKALQSRAPGTRPSD